MLRVAISLDDKKLVAVFPDRNATKAWRRGNLRTSHDITVTWRHVVELNGHYDRESGLLAVWTGEESAVGATAECATDLAVFVSTEDGYHVVGFEVIGGGPYFRLEYGYDSDLDTLTIGDTADTTAMRTQNGALVAHWRPDPLEPTEVMDPIGVTVHGAKALMQRVKLL